ncbi:hypothetical protein [Shewanella sp. UCD-KL12]|uniref:hypothetical protein n=1 Tax=Shewanella sp. UCD-KL12 TaxID=1917163 RepID=UPI0009704E85|nr:hypothetical protein [Shewanella sp. UCD-KL12]
MKNLTIAILVIAIIYGIYDNSSTKETVSDIITLTPVAAEFTSDLSRSWSYQALEKHIDSKHLISNEQNYRSMLEKAKPLGQMERCNKLQMNQLHKQKTDGPIVVSGVCQFEYGTASLMLVFSHKIEEFEIIAWSIKSA